MVVTARKMFSLRFDLVVIVSVCFLKVSSKECGLGVDVDGRVVKGN